MHGKSLMNIERKEEKEQKIAHTQTGRESGEKLKIPI